MEVSPSVLEFKGSFTQQTTEYLTLTNTSSSPLAFKVKTTAPKLYCVRPNASVVQPNDSIKISIILQGFSQPLTKDFKCKDKFLIVSLPCPEVDDIAKIGETWPSLEAQYKQQMVSKKLRVNYVITPDSQGGEAANSASGSGAGAAGVAGLTAPSAPATHSSVSTPERPSDKSINDAYASPAKDQFSNNNAQGDDLQKELDASNAEINNLSNKLDTNQSGINNSEKAGEASLNEKVTGGSTKAQVAGEEPVSGLSLPFAIALVLLAFILGWLIF